MIRHSFHAPLEPEELRFLSEHTGVDFMPFNTSGWLCVTGRDRTGLGEEDYWPLFGVCVFEPKTWFDWHMSCAIEDPRVMSRRMLRAMFRAVFSRARRVTALVEPDNKRALDQMKRLGFQYEGYSRLGIEGSRDALIWGMLPADCPFLPGYQASTIIPTDFAGAHNGQLT